MCWFRKARADAWALGAWGLRRDEHGLDGRPYRSGLRGKVWRHGKGFGYAVGGAMILAGLLLPWLFWMEAALLG
jgi:hypothetical protein